MRSLKIELIAVLCFLGLVSGRNDHTDVNLGPDNLQKGRDDTTEFHKSITRALMKEGYSPNYLKDISDGVVQIERDSDERDLFVRRICKIIERIYNDGRYFCECSMKPLAPQVSYTCERYTENQSGRASYGVRYQGSFIFRYLALSLATPASVCLTDMTYRSSSLNGGRGGFLTFGDICIESELEIDVNPLRGDVTVSVDNCNVQLGDNLGTCTFCGQCPTGPGFYIDCTDIWPLPFCVPNDIPFIGGRRSGDRMAAEESATQDIGGEFFDGDSFVGGGGSSGGGLVGAVGQPNPEKLFNALDMTRLMQERVQAILAEQTLSQATTTTTPPDQGGQQTGMTQKPTDAWQPWADTDGDSVEIDGKPAPSTGSTGLQAGTLPKPTNSWQPWEDTDDDDDSLDTEQYDMTEPYEDWEDPGFEPFSTEQYYGSKKGGEKGASKEKKTKGLKGDTAEKQESKKGTKKSTSVKSQKEGKDNKKSSSSGKDKGNKKYSSGNDKGNKKSSSSSSSSGKDKGNKKSSSGKDKGSGGGSSMRIQNLSGPSNQQLYEDVAMQPVETIQTQSSSSSTKKGDKGDKKSSSNNRDDGPRMQISNLSGSSNQQLRQYNDYSPEQPVAQSDSDHSQEFRPWFKGFLRKSG